MDDQARDTGASCIRIARTDEIAGALARSGRSCEHPPRPILHPPEERVGAAPALSSARARRASRSRPDRRPPGPALRHGGRRHLLRERLLDLPLLGRDAGELPRSSIERQSARPMSRTSRDRSNVKHRSPILSFANPRMGDG